MKKSTIIIGSAIAFILIVVLIWISTSNKEVRLRSQVAAQSEVCQSYFDKLFKVLAQKAQVADQYKEAFKEIYPALIEGRYGNDKGGTLMKFIQESNPNFDVSLYKDLQNSIEAERAGFFMEQKKLIDLNNEHRIVRRTFPGSIFVGGRSDIAIVVVSSDRTKEVFQTGKDNDIDLFKK